MIAPSRFKMRIDGGDGEGTMIEKAAGRDKTVHKASCAAWDIPATDGPFGDPESAGAVAAYSAAVGPIYRSLSASVGHAALLLLLSTDRRLHDFRSGYRDGGPACRDLHEAMARLAGLSVPTPLCRHHWVLVRSAAALKDVWRRLDERPLWNGGTERAAAMDLIQVLKGARGLLQLAAMPHAGMSTVDLAAACCNCGHKEPPMPKVLASTAG